MIRIARFSVILAVASWSIAVPVLARTASAFGQSGGRTAPATIGGLGFRSYGGNSSFVRSLPNGDTGSAATLSAVSIQASSDAQFFSRCVTSGDSVALHDAIDGQPNRYVSERGLDAIVRAHQSCYRSTVAAPQPQPTFYGNCNPRPVFFSGLTEPVAICQSFFDRGALIERVLATYVPDLSFTTVQLNDPAVILRFNERQDRLGRTESKAAQRYFLTVACLVARHPQAALSLRKTELGGKDETALRRMLISGAPACIGSNRKVDVDPAEFRVVVADAVYSWAVALRGADTLLPTASQMSLSLASNATTQRSGE